MRTLIAAALLLALAAPASARDKPKPQQSQPASQPLVASCWGCMHGCTPEDNARICHLAPPEQRP